MERRLKVTEGYQGTQRKLWKATGKNNVKKNKKKKKIHTQREFLQGITVCSFQRGFPWLIFRVHGGKPRFEHGWVGRDGFHGEIIGRIDRPFNDQNFQSAVLKLVPYIILSVSIYRHDIHYQIFDIKMGRNVSRCFSSIHLS